jgi:hypothetical protein
MAEKAGCRDNFSRLAGAPKTSSLTKSEENMSEPVMQITAPARVAAYVQPCRAKHPAPLARLDGFAGRD